MKKILIVEDQMLARKYLCSCIEKSTECEMASALTRADAALQRCGEGHIDLVVMDICTENDSDGLDAAEAIKKYYPPVKPSGDIAYRYCLTVKQHHGQPDKPFSLCGSVLPATINIHRCHTRHRSPF